jgi:hypothetical protein
MFKNFTIIRTLVVLLAFGLTIGLSAADLNWTGAGGNTSWHNPANWDTGTVPTNEDVVFLDDDDYVVITAAAEAFNLRMNNGATLSILPNGQLSFTSLIKSVADLIIMEDGTSLLNSGMISMAADTERNNIDANGSSFINNNGTMALSQSDDESMFLYEGAYMANYGLLAISSPNEDGIDMEDGAVIENFATISIEDIGTEGIDMDNGSEFYNMGTLQLEMIDDNDAIDMDDGGTLFVNYATIEIINVIESGEGIEVDDGLFVNEESGNITLTNTTGDGIYIQDDGELLNFGYISIDHNPDGSSDNAVELNCDGFFYNNGILEITNNGSTDAIELECSSSEFVNDECGEINILTNSPIDIQSSGSFDNYGILTTAFTGTNTNFGTFSNGGKITSPNGFQIAPNAVVDDSSLPFGWAGFDVGNAGTLGNDFCFLSCNEEYVVTGGGNNATSSTTDNVAFLSMFACGNNVSITAKVESVDPNGYGGLMIREPESDGARQVSIFSNLTNVLRHEARFSTNGPKQVQAFYKPSPFWLRLQRQGDWVFAYYSTTGTNFTYIHAVFVPMDACVEIGLASFTYQPGQQTTAVFSNVTVTGGVYGPEAEAPVETEIVATKQQQQLNLYPNPAVNEVTLTFAEALEQDATVVLRNKMGQVIEQRQLRAGNLKAQWEVSNHPVGMYLLEIHQEGRAVESLRFVKSR